MGIETGLAPPQVLLRSNRPETVSDAHADSSSFAGSSNSHFTAARCLGVRMSGPVRSATGRPEETEGLVSVTGPAGADLAKERGLPGDGEVGAAAACTSCSEFHFAAKGLAGEVRENLRVWDGWRRWAMGSATMLPMGTLNASHIAAITVDVAFPAKF